MTSDDRVGDYLEHGPAASGEAEVPDGAVHVRQILGSAAVWGGPPPDGLDGVLGRIRSERSAAYPAAEGPAAVPVARVRDTPSGVAISLDVSGLPPAAPSTYYEGWVGEVARRPSRLSC